MNVGTQKGGWIMSEWQMDNWRSGINERRNAKPRKIGADTGVTIRELYILEMLAANARKSLAEI